MKNTKIMIAVIATILITWLGLSGFAYWLSDISYRDVVVHPGIITIMFVVGWIPSIIVANDLENTLK